jgi:hypothetical protein
MLVCVEVLFSFIILIGNNLIITIMMGLFMAGGFYMLILSDISLTPTHIEIRSEGVFLTFLIGKSVMCKWDDFNGWVQTKAAGVDSFVGIRLKNKKMYHFDKGAAAEIKNRYFEINGRPIKKL